MLAFAQNWFAARPNPIGIDLGSDTLRLAQVQDSGQSPTLFAAASCEVPDFARVDLESRLDFFEQAVRDLLTRGKFRGRSAVLSLPASLMFMHKLRLPKLNDADLKQAIAVECKGKLPINPDAALLRHVVAGQVMVHGRPMLEVIALAAPREAVDKYLAAASRAKLDVIDMKIEPMALIDCFSRVHCRKADSDAVTLYVDLGATGTRMIAAQGSHLLGLSMVELGGHDFDRAIAAAMQISIDDARLIRLKHSTTQTSLLVRDIRDVSPKPLLEPQAAQVAVAQADTTARLIAAVVDCRQRHDTTFHTHPIQRLIFIGGEASAHGLCTQIAQSIGLPAQIGDPLVRMGRSSEIPIETGIDRRLPQPAWAVAIGLSFDAVQATRSQHQAAATAAGEAA